MDKHNPKYIEAQKRGKADYSVIPWEAIHGLVQAMMEGAGKYGRFNFLQDDIEARTYIAAIGRHMFGDPSTGSRGWVNGEDIDVESGLHHLDKVMACCLLVRAAEKHGKLIDNRMFMESKAPPVPLDVALNDALVKADTRSAERHAINRHHYGVGIGEPHEPTREEIIDMEKGPRLLLGDDPHWDGPWDVVFTDNSPGIGVASEHRRGPYETIELAENYARRNPERLPGLKSINPSKSKLRK